MLKLHLAGLGGSKVTGDVTELAILILIVVRLIVKILFLSNSVILPTSFQTSTQVNI